VDRDPADCCESWRPDSERELAEARRWQFQQAYATWDRFRRGEGRTVPREQIDQIFTDALAQRNQVTRSP